MITGILDFFLKHAVHLRWQHLCRKKRRLLFRNAGLLHRKRQFLRPGAYRFEKADGPALHFAAPTGERITVAVLEDHLVRVTCLPEGKPRLDRTWTVSGKDGTMPRNGRPRDDYSPFACPPFHHERDGGRIIIRTDCLRLTVTMDPFAIAWDTPEGQPIAADDPSGAYFHDAVSTAVRHRMLHREFHYYGFGERSGPIDKKGRRMLMMDVDVMGYSAEKQDPLYKHIPFYITLEAGTERAHGIFYDNLSFTEFDMAASERSVRNYTADDGDIDYYFIYGPSIEEVVRRYASLTGPMILPPRWTLGYLGSTMTYTELPNAQEELKKFAELCDAHEIPCDLFHLSSGYTTGDDGKRYVFKWNRNKVPDPAGMVQRFHDSGIRLTANIKPCMLTTHPRYAEVAGRGGFIGDPRGGPHVTPFWGGVGSYLDFTNVWTYQWWKDNIKEHLLSFGIDSTWNDNNEFEIWDERCTCHGFGRPIAVSQLRPVMTLLMNQASMEAQTETSQGIRPFLISRSGCPGLQRYAQTWTGDNYSSWNALKFNIPMGLGLSLSGLYNIGHDVGGFFGFRPGPELFVRWVQSGIFHPRFTIHSWHVDKSVNEPWMYPAVLPVIRETIRFRYRLIPFLYSLLFAAATRNEPMLRPMAYQFPDDPRCRIESFDYLLGDRLLVASVVEKGARTRSIYLPGGGEWTDFHTGARYRGGATVSVPAPLERIPLMVREGGIIPTGKSMKFVGAEPDDLRRVYLFPGSGDGDECFHLIEDDGVSDGYQRGEFTDVTISMKSDAQRIELHVETRGNYILPYREMEFMLPQGEKREFICSGEITRHSMARDGRMILAMALR